MRASLFTAQIPAERNNLGRLVVDRDLRIPSLASVFATDDAAKAASDKLGNFALMSRQRAVRMGTFAGNNAAAKLLGRPTSMFHQETYVTCLDLGAEGRIYTRGQAQEAGAH